MNYYAPGEYSYQYITNEPIDKSDPRYMDYHRNIVKYPMEGVYIYSFTEGRMIYADGWEKIVGIPDEQISMHLIPKLTVPEFYPFVHEINDKALMFLHERNERLTEYSFQIEIKLMHSNGMKIPVSARVSVHSTNNDGSLASIMGRFQVDHSIRFGKVMRFWAYGPEKDIFENTLNDQLFYTNRISEKEMEVIRLIANGLTYKEISEHLYISISAVEKRIRTLFQRFELKNNAHLVGFAYENFLLP